VKILEKIGKVLGIFAILMGAVALFGPTEASVSAEEVPKYRIQVSPASLELDLTPGKTTEAFFDVQNTGQEPFGFELSAAPYSVVDENYTQNFEEETIYTDLAEWVTFSEDEGDVEPGGSHRVKIKVSVPKDVPAGGQYASVMVRMVEKTEGGSGQSAISADKRIALLLYSTVEGNTRKEGKILENKVAGFRFQPPVTATSVVENTGNVHATATYTLQVFPFFGGEEVYSNEENPEKWTILPETKRYNEMVWEGAPALGIFKVKQTVNFLGQDSVEEKVVFLCPIWFLFIILLLVFGIVFWIVNRVRGRRME